MANKILNLDLSKDPIMHAIIYGRIADDRMQTVTVNITRRDEVADLTGCKITFEGTTHSGQTKVFDTNNVSSTPSGLKKGTFDYTFPNMTFAVAGKYDRAYFSITKDGKRDTTADFDILVTGNADIDAPEAKTIITEYNKLVDDLQKLQKQNISDLQKQQNAYIQSSDDEFKAIQARITDLETQIDNYEKAFEEITSEAVVEVEQALNKFKNGDFYTKLEADNRFAKKTDLNNVDNFATATQAEAEAGLATNKFMTPVLVFKAIAKWVQGKFVNATEPQTVLGTKNFQDGIQLEGIPLIESVRQLSQITGSVPSGRPFRVSRQMNHCILELYITGLSGKNVSFVTLPEGFRMVENKNFNMKSTGGKMAYAWYDSTTNAIIIGRTFTGSGEADIVTSDYFEVALSYRTADKFPR